MENPPKIEIKTQGKKADFTIEEPVIGSSCRFFIGYTFEEMKKIVDERKHPTEKGLDDEWDHCDGMAMTIRNLQRVPSHMVWLKRFDWEIKPFGVLAHELVHLVTQIFNNANIPVRAENDEMFAYMHEFYFTSALRELNK